MEDKNFVIVGANGQLGKALCAKYPNANAVDSDKLDITDFTALSNFDWSNVTHILNAAAYTNVDAAETPEGRVLAWKVNGQGVANLVKVAQENNITLVHISSDYVFDGTKENHSEDEELSPISVYGSTKAVGDLLVSTSQKYYILRTSWVIGDGKNFVKTMVGLAERDISPTVVSDQVGRLTFTSELVRAISHLLQNDLPSGIYNLSNSGEPASWAEITREIFTGIGRDDLTVSDTTTAEYFKGKDNIAPRPLKSTLDLSKIQSTSFTSVDWKEDLRTYLKGEV